MSATILHRTDTAAAIRALRADFLGGARPDPGALVRALASQTGSGAALAERATALAPQAGEVVLAVPVLSGSRWLGDLILRREGPPFSEEEELLAEFAAALAGVVMTADEAHAVEEDHQRRAAARAAAASLSITERRAMRQLLQAWNGRPVTVRLKDAAEAAGVHHSSLVQALARLRAAGVIEAGSRGRRGVRLHVLNPLLLDELAD